jgi:hypothetical protein
VSGVLCVIVIRAQAGIEWWRWQQQQQWQRVRNDVVCRCCG